jgi:predicted phage baseplate assembly protein
MALVSPILDDRSYAQLKDELVRRISVYTPEWTDHNESDPGIALLELFAYLGESTLFRFNQIPETTKIEFLRLLGVRARTARPAAALLAATTDRAAGVPIESGTEVRAGSVVFSTTGATQVWPVEVVAVGKTAAPEVPDADATNAADRVEADRRADARSRARLADDEPAVFYVTTPVPVDPMAAEAVPLDVDLTLDRSLWVAVLRTRSTDLAALGGRSLFVAVAFDETLERPFALQDLDDAAGRFGSPDLATDPPPMLWRLWNGPGREFTVLDVGDDTTRGLVTSGVVEVLLPQRIPLLDPQAPGAGAEDEPPPLDDTELAARVLAWIQVGRPETDHLNDGVGRVRWVGVNGLRAEQARTARPELLGTGTGDADQVYPLSQHPVLPGTTRVQVQEDGTWQDWVEVDTFVLSGPDDRHYTVDHDAGTVHFGGTLVPQLGQQIRVASYRYGGGVAGNVPAGALGAIDTGGVRVTNPLPAVGGSNAASLIDALDAIPAQVHRQDRAVVADDFATLAVEVTGVARAETLALLHPDRPHVETPGVVTVVVFAAEDLTAPQAPLPGLGLLRRVAAFLDERRLVTTELYVVPPTYRRLAVSIGLAVRTGYQVDAVRRWVDTILRQYLAPLPPLGPDGAGWPLGRAVRVAELEAVAVQVEGVEFVTGSAMGVPDGAGGYDPADVVLLDRWEVPELVDLVVTAGDPLPVGAAHRPVEPAGRLVPLPPDVC